MQKFAHLLVELHEFSIVSGKILKIPLDWRETSKERKIPFCIFCAKYKAPPWFHPSKFLDAPNYLFPKYEVFPTDQERSNSTSLLKHRFIRGWGIQLVHRNTQIHAQWRHLSCLPPASWLPANKRAFVSFHQVASWKLLQPSLGWDYTDDARESLLHRTDEMLIYFFSNTVFCCCWTGFCCIEGTELRQPTAGLEQQHFDGFWLYLTVPVCYRIIH